MEILAFIVLMGILFIQHRRLNTLEKDMDRAAALIQELNRRLPLPGPE